MDVIKRGGGSANGRWQHGQGNCLSGGDSAGGLSSGKRGEGKKERNSMVFEWSKKRSGHSELKVTAKTLEKGGKKGGGRERNNCAFRRQD